MRAIKQSNFIKWFYLGINVKRWLLLMSLGVAIMGLGFSYFLREVYVSYTFPDSVYYITLQFLPRWLRGLLFFAISGGVILFAFWKLNNSLLSALLRRSGDESLVSVLYSNRYLARGPKVVAIGGGTGLSTLLRGLKEHTSNLTAVVTVADDGGSSGRLSPALGLPPPGDCRRALLALSPDPSPWRDAACHRFQEGDVAGHSLGNLILAGLAASEGGLERALETLGRLLGARGRVVPASSQPLELRAVVEGAEVRGQVAIALGRGRIEALTVDPPGADASPAALDALAAADQVVIGPGSLFTSLGAVLVVPGMVAALNDSKAQLVYVCNLTTQDGETLGLDGTGHVRALMEVAGMRPPDVVVANEAAFPVPATVEAVRADRAEIEALGPRVELAALADPSAPWPQHDPARLGAVLRRLA